jgi:predicted outer membrane repeat protein
MKWGKQVPVVVALLVLASTPARAASLYVTPSGTGDGSAAGSPANLQAALDIARTNGESDTLLLAAGVYDASAAGASTFEFDAGIAGSDALPVTIRGGWDAAFTSQSEDPVATALSGWVSARVLHIRADAPGAVANITLELVGILDGKTTAASSPGAGILATQSSGGAVTLTVDRCVFHGNVADNNSGGAIAAQGPITVTDSRFTYNRGDTGGAVYLWATSTPARFTGCEFSDNSIGNPGNPGRLYGWQGSTIFSTSPNLIVEGCEFRGMSDGSTSGAGSTIYLHTNGYLTARNSSFRDISILNWGSAIQLWDAAANISGCLFANNRAGTSSGYAAVTYLDTTHPTCSNSKATSIVNSTFVGNRDDSDFAGDVHFRCGNLTIRNSIFSATTPSSGISCQGGTGSIDYSAVERGAAGVSGLSYGAHNTAAAPSFQAGDPDYKLNWDSPLIDAGYNDAVPADLRTDFKDAPRIFASAKDRENPVVDLGWDEYVDFTLDLTAPVEGATWLNDGTPKTIAWYCNNIGGNVDIALWKGPREGAVKVLDIATDPVRCDAQSYAWTIPGDLEDGMDYAVVIAPSFYSTLERGAAPINIQHLHLTSPNYGNWVQGSTYTITWESSDLAGATVLIELYDGDDPVGTIAAAAPNTGSYRWKVPLAQAPGSSFRIKLSTTSPRAAEDWSDNAFGILPAVTVTAPNGGQSIKRGTTYKITWKFRNSPGSYVRIDLYKGGVFNRTITRRAPIGAGGRGWYLWRVPATQSPAKTYTIRVRSVRYPNCFDFSNRAFTIKR